MLEHDARNSHEKRPQSPSCYPCIGTGPVNVAHPIESADRMLMHAEAPLAGLGVVAQDQLVVIEHLSIAHLTKASCFHRYSLVDTHSTHPIGTSV